MTTGSHRPDYDQSLKRLISSAPQGFVALVAPGATFRAEMPTELPASVRHADLVWEVTTADGQLGTLHIELQTKPTPDIGERLVEYGLRLWQRDHRPVRSIVVFLRPAPTIPASPFVVEWDGIETLRYAFEVIRIWEVPQERILGTPFHRLWPLAGLMAGVTVDSMLAVADRLAETPTAADERDDLLQSLVLLAGMRLSRASLRNLLQRRRDMLKDLWEESVLKDVLADIALEDAEVRGKAEGKAEEMRHMARIALEGRFGPLADDLLAALNAADEATCEALVAHVSTDTLDQARSRLGLA